MSEGLPRAAIIRRRAVFDTARKSGRRVSTRHFLLNFLAREAAPGDSGSAAFLTPKRLGPAAVRNRLRRRMREIHRRELAGLAASHYLIWVARPAALELDFAQLKATMLAMRRRVG